MNGVVSPGQRAAGSSRGEPRGSARTAGLPIVLCIPEDALVEILARCDFPSLTALRCTCRHMKECIERLATENVLQRSFEATCEAEIPAAWFRGRSERTFARLRDCVAATVALRLADPAPGVQRISLACQSLFFPHSIVRARLQSIGVSGSVIANPPPGADLQTLPVAETQEHRRTASAWELQVFQSFLRGVCIQIVACELYEYILDDLAVAAAATLPNMWGSRLGIGMGSRWIEHGAPVLAALACAVWDEPDGLALLLQFGMVEADFSAIADGTNFIQVAQHCGSERVLALLRDSTMDCSA